LNLQSLQLFFQLLEQARRFLNILFVSGFFRQFKGGLKIITRGGE
jgi:hypothetical protein